MCTALPDYIEQPIKEKLRHVIATVVKYLPEGPERAFVSTGIDQGVLKYLSVWLFTENLIAEIRNPLRSARIHFEMARFKNTVDWIRLNAHGYDFGDPREDSRLELEFTTIDSLSGVISANGEGCRHLMQIYQERFRPNFVANHNID